MAISNQILIHSMPPLPSGAEVIFSEDPKAKKRALQATISSEADLFELFQRYLSFSDINETCKFVCLPPPGSLVGFTAEFSVMNVESKAGELILLCKTTIELPSLSQLKESLMIPWALHTHQVYFSNADESIDRVRARFNSVFDFTMKNQDIFYRNVHRLNEDGLTAYEDQQRYVCDQIIPEYEKIHTSHDQMGYLQPLHCKNEEDDYFRAVVEYHMTKPVGSLAYSRISLMHKGGEVPQVEDDFDAMIMSIGNIDEVLENLPRIGAAIHETIHQNIFSQIYRAQEERRLFLQEKAAYQLEQYAFIRYDFITPLLERIFQQDSDLNFKKHDVEHKKGVPGMEKSYFV